MQQISKINTSGRSELFLLGWFRCRVEVPVDGQTYPINCYGNIYADITGKHYFILDEDRESYESTNYMTVYYATEDITDLFEDYEILRDQQGFYNLDEGDITIYVANILYRNKQQMIEELNRRLLYGSF